MEDKKRLIPIADRVVIKAIVETESKSGIILSSSIKEKPIKGIVIAVGKGISPQKMTLRDGDTVIFGKNAGVEMEINGENYLIMREHEVFAIIG